MEAVLRVILGVVLWVILRWRCGVEVTQDHPKRHSPTAREPHTPAPPQPVVAERLSRQGRGNYGIMFFGIDTTNTTIFFLNEKKGGEREKKNEEKKFPATPTPTMPKSRQRRKAEKPKPKPTLSLKPTSPINLMK